MSAVAAILLPLTLMLLFPAPDRFRRIAIGLTPWSGVLLFWPLVDQPSVTFSWPLVGVTLGVDSINRPLILLTALAWNLSAWFAWNTIERDRRWFWSGWLGALAGMSLLLLAGDIASFYVGYALLSLSAYLLITHEHNAQAWRAARMYLIMAFAGEAAILTGILLLAGSVGNVEFSHLGDHASVLLDSPARWFLLAGFAVKMGIMPLHMWLPLAHPVAPVPASAILSGVIVKAGLLGWLRFVPAFQEDPAWVAWLLMGFGLSTAFLGVFFGLFQQRIKTLLAYSTISQMGLILTAFGLTFLAPDARPALLAIIGLMALHHGLNKTALFLACGSALTIGRAARVLFALPALSLAAFPLSSGYLAKNALKDALPGAVHEPLMNFVLALTSTATALLMWRAWQLAAGIKTRNPTLQPAWLLVVAASLLVPWGWALAHDLASWPKTYLLWSATWPLLLALLLITIRHQRGWQAAIEIPEGDLVVWLERFAGRFPGLTAPADEARRKPSDVLRRWRRYQGRYEKQQRTIQATGLASLLLIGLIWLLFWL